MRLDLALIEDFPRFAGVLAARVNEPYLVEHVLPPATTADLQRLESELGVPLPASYKQLLTVTRGFWLSGGVVQLSTTHPFFHEWEPLAELTPQQRRSVQQKGGRWPPPTGGMLCFAEYFLEADGDQVLWDVKSGPQDGEYPVMYYAHESYPPSVRRVASSFREWLEQCLDPFPRAGDDL
jgi:cell wall assembly regulator SMI1